ncbi:hypothetical protein CEXT_138001 [Caerostris extrusa]|uniref:Uncharacterized protein n=1 Tax=Caerostris extrusa TaxID=172846 RepID=A0AAV4M8D2_CAEEX|nr:hypothetical protein CEXT_138001 [Caerostris extrusa]
MALTLITPFCMIHNSSTENHSHYTVARGGCGNLSANPNEGNEFPNSSKGQQLRAGFNLHSLENGGQSGLVLVSVALISGYNNRSTNKKSDN